MKSPIKLCANAIGDERAATDLQRISDRFAETMRRPNMDKVTLVAVVAHTLRALLDDLPDPGRGEWEDYISEWLVSGEGKAN